MGFLKKFFRSVFHEGGQMPEVNSSFQTLSEDELESHLSVFKYGNFLLTDAIRPSYDLKVVPAAGFRHDVYQDEDTRSAVPVIMAAVSREKLFDLFIDMIDQLGNTVDVVLETSHQRDTAGHIDLYREHIDMPVLKSILYDYEDLLLNDGCTGIAVLNPHTPQEVQFDEHKLLITYGTPLEAYEKTLRDWQIPLNEDISFITEAEHVHSSSDRYIREFDELKMRLGIDSMFE